MMNPGKFVVVCCLAVGMTFSTAAAHAKTYRIIREPSGRVYVVDPEAGLWYKVRHPIKFIKNKFKESRSQYEGFNKTVTQKDMETETESVTEQVTDSAAKTVEKVPGVTTVKNIFTKVAKGTSSKSTSTSQ